MSTATRASEATAAGTVSLGLVVATRPARREALCRVFAALLHAGFSFGRDQPGRVVYSYDPQGEDYAPPMVVPSDEHRPLAQALATLTPLARHYNQSIGFSLPSGRVAIPVTARIYNERSAVAIKLDFGRTGWRQLVGTHRTVRCATIALVDVGRTLFTLARARYLLIGPSQLLADLPRLPTADLLRSVPVAIVATGGRPLVKAARTLAAGEHCEQIAYGRIVIRRWNAAAGVEASRAKRARTAARPDVRST